MASPVVALLVNGRRYEGWQTIRINRSIESIANSFTLDVSDRWAGQNEPWPIAEEDACKVEVDGVVVLDGWIDRRMPTLDGATRRLAFTGRGKAGVLVDCSAVLPAWSFRKLTAFDIAKKVAEPFSIKVSLQPGLTLPKIPKLVVNPGDRCFPVIQRAAEQSGCLVVSDGQGGVVLTQSGTSRATALVEGQNILRASGDFNAQNRYHRYLVATQIPGTKETFGDATRIKAEAVDMAVRRTDRILWIQPDQGMDAAAAKRRADWEARIRAAKADAVTIGVQDWRQPDGSLWPVNALTVLQSKAVGVNGDMLIANVGHVIADGVGIETELRLVRPDAFTPEVSAVLKDKGKGVDWKELAGGLV